MENKVYRILASSCQARLNCLEEERTTDHVHEWTSKHRDTIDYIVDNFLPHGSGIDSGTKFNFDSSNGDKLVFTFGYHHMNEGGYYDGWTDHTLTVKPSLQFGFTCSISGRNRNQIKEYLYDIYSDALNETLEWDNEKERYFSPAMREASKAYQESIKEEVKALSAKNKLAFEIAKGLNTGK